MEKRIKIDGIDLEKPEYSFHIQLKETPVGFSLESGENGQYIKVARRGFYSNFDGELFYIVLDSVSGLFLNDWCLKERTRLSNISNCLIFIQQNNSAEVHINCPVFLTILPKRRVEGQIPIYKHDIADVKEIRFQGVELKSNCAVIYIFSVGWRRGIYFDLFPLDCNSGYTNGDLSTIFASLHSNLQFPEIHRMELPVREKMFELGWFPFIRIIGKNYDDLYNCLKYNFQVSEVEIEIAKSFSEELILEMKDSWLQTDLFKEHQILIERGIERFISEDYISSISILYPRIEGIMRHIYLGESKQPTTKTLIEKIVTITQEKTIINGLFIPDVFGQYLSKFLFNSFNLAEDKLDFSRNSLSHGVAKQEDFSKIKAIQAILILDQIYFYILQK